MTIFLNNKIRVDCRSAVLLFGPCHWMLAWFTFVLSSAEINTFIHHLKKHSNNCYWHLTTCNLILLCPLSASINSYICFHQELFDFLNACNKKQCEVFVTYLANILSLTLSNIMLDIAPYTTSTGGLVKKKMFSWVISCLFVCFYFYSLLTYLPTKFQIGPQKTQKRQAFLLFFLRTSFLR